MKKLISTLLVLAFVMTACVLPAGAVEKSAGLSEDKIIETVGALEIMQGDSYGNLNLENKVTRAEFTKMAVCASLYKDDANVKIAYSPFPDVPADHWGAGFIRAGVGAGWITGYLDGTFRPSGNVKLEEAVTIVLKMLGYTAADFIGSYPDGQLAKYESLELDTGISAKMGAELTRRECMYLIYNTLCTNTKGGTAYCKTLGYACDEYGNIDYSALIDSKKKGPYIVTDVSEWKNALSLGENIKVYKDGKNVSETEICEGEVVYCSPEFSTVWIYDKKTAGVIEGFLPSASLPRSVILSGKTYNIATDDTVKTNLSAGEFSVDDSVVLILGENDEAVEAYIAEKVYSADKDTAFPQDKSLYLNGKSIKEASLSGKALVYECGALSGVFIYDGDVSGVITSVLPSKQDPDTVYIGEKSYQLASNVKELFKNETVFGEKDFVTAYTGASGKIEYVEKADIYDTDIYKDNGLSYEALVGQTLDGPVVVSGEGWKEKLGFDADTASYYCDGKQVDSSIIHDYDVIYYSPTFKSVWIYSDKVTGVIEEVLPNMVTPSSVKVAGSQYAIETSDAAISFGGKGEFSVGDTVTLVLGRNGIVSAESPDKTSETYLGISTDVSKKEYKGNDGQTYIDYYVTVSAFDGRIHSVKTDDSGFDIGVPVIVSYTGGNMTVKQLSVRYNSVSDLVTAVKKGKIAPDAVLVDRFARTFINTYASRLSEISITKDNVIYYNINSDGYLDYLVLDDATGDIHSYGVIFKDGDRYSFVTSSANNNISDFTVPITGAVGVKYNGQTAQRIMPLSEFEVSSIDSGMVSIGGKSYKLWDYCECFVMEQTKYYIPADSNSTLSDVITETSLDHIKSLLSGGGYRIKGYYDSTGTVRVLVAQKIY